MRILGVDFGDARTGLAVSDPGAFLASPAGAIKETNLTLAAKAVAKAAEDYNAVEIVVGYPKNMNGTLGERARKTDEFVKKLKMYTSLPVVLFDERCTTLSAARVLNETNTRGQKRKHVIDALSAQIMLQNYLDMKNSRGSQQN